MARPSWLGRAVRNRHRHAIEQASRRTCRKILISTQVKTVPLRALLDAYAEYFYVDGVQVHARPAW